MEQTNTPIITPLEVWSLINHNVEGYIYVDVRESDEYQKEHPVGFINIALSGMFDTYKDLPRNATIIVSCRSGGRSSRAAKFLRLQGYPHVLSMKGGILEWKGEGLPTT